MLESKWGLRLIAFLLALGIFLQVNNVFEVFGNDQFSQTQQTVITDVPVKAIYDDENLYLSGAPKTVNVKISGPQSIVKKTQSLMDFTVALDLSNSKVGDYKKSFKVTGISDKLKYEVMPLSANVSLSEKIQDTRKVEAEISSSRIAPGYELVGQEVDPSQVTITGGEDEINKIAYVKATLSDSEKLTKSTTSQAEVNVFDASLNKLDVTVKPSKVKVNTKVVPTSKTVDITANEKGKLPSGLKLKSIELSDDKVELFGKRSVLDGIGSLTIDVDLSKVTESTTIKQKLSLPKDVTSSEPETIEINIEVTKN